MDEQQKAVEKALTKSILAEITMLCEKQKDCRSCPLKEETQCGSRNAVGCLLMNHSPMGWNLEKIAEVVANDK